jgi:hypothetical protein
VTAAAFSLKVARERLLRFHRAKLGLALYLDDSVGQLLQVHADGRARVAGQCPEDDGSLVVENDFGRASFVNPAGLASLLGGFYQGLFAGQTVPDAFKQGRDLMQVDPITNSEYEVPILLVRRGLRPAPAGREGCR